MTRKETMMRASVSNTPAEQDVYVFPTSFAQQRLWFLDQLEPGSATYNMVSTVRITAPLNEEALVRSLNALIERHEILRTTFLVRDGQPMQVVAPTLSVPLPIVDLQPLPQQEREAEAFRLANQEAQQPFDLTKGLLMRTTLLRLGAQEYVLLLVIHHIIFDGWSEGVFFRELETLYQAFATGASAALPDLPIQYADFAAWQREWLQGEVLEEQLAYWKQQLAEAPSVLELPTDHPRPAVPSNRGSNRPFRLSQALTEAIKSLSQQQGMSLFMTLAAAFQTLLYRYSGQQDLLLGTVTADRSQPETENLIGFFVNTLVLRTDLSGDPTFRDLLARVREVVLEAQAHQDVPFEYLVRELHPDRSPGQNPFFQVMLAIEPYESDLPSDWVLNQMDVKTNTAKFDLSLELEDRPDGLLGRFEYNTDLFEEATINRLIGHWQTLLEGIVAHPEQHLSELPLLTGAERQQMLVEWNATGVEYPDKLCVHQLFEAQVERTPEAVALIFEGREMTYRELNTQANKLAHHLRRLGVGAEVLVGLCVERSWEMVVGLLGILKAGGAYVPLDPAYPRDRLIFMLQDAQVKVMLTQECLRGVLPTDTTQTICLDTDWEFIAEASTENVDSGVTPENLAYVIYTSGSMGKPKGVLIEHGSLTRYLCWVNEQLLGNRVDNLPVVTGLSFDMSLKQVFGPFIHGSAVWMLSEDVLADPVALLQQLLARTKVGLNCVPALWKVLLDAIERDQASIPTERLRYLFLGGDELRKELIKRSLSALPHLEIWNIYGPTEATANATMARIDAEDRVTIGRPIANTKIYIMDAQLQPVPIGVPGELYIGGANLARGYLNRPELTAERFIPNPFSKEPDARLYRTGDLARYLPDGNIEFLGRIDYQVKIRGFRIELGEIEAVLRRHPGIQEAVVVAREDVPGDKRLVAYIVPREEQSASISDLRSYLMQQLPGYMVPASFVLLEALPLTPTGKVNRRALPAPNHEDSNSQETFVAPRTPVEKGVAAIWRRVLGVEQIGIHDNFFALGGHSLLAMQVIAHLRTTLQVELPLRSFFEAPTVAQFAEIIAQVQASGAKSSMPVLGSISREAHRVPIIHKSSAS